MTKQTTKVEASPVVDAKEIKEPTLLELKEQVGQLQKQIIAAHQMIDMYKDTIVKLSIRLS